MIFNILLILTVAAREGTANGETCTTTDCDETGKRIAEYMDESPKYCEDFYQSACGGFLKNKKFPYNDGDNYLKDKLEEDILKQVENILEETPGPSGDVHALVKNMYELCKKNDNNYNQIIETVRSNLEGVGDWPLFNEKWSGESWKFEEVEIKLRNKGFKHGSLVRFRVVMDQTIPQQYILQILPGEQQWMDLNDLQSKNKNYLIYHQSMIKAVKLLTKSEDEKAAKNYADTTLDFYTKLVQMVDQNGNKGDLQGKLFKVKNLKTVVPQINWMELLKGLMAGITEPSDEDEVYIRDVDYLHSLENLLDVHRKEAANVILWQAVRELLKINGLPSKNSQIRQEPAHSKQEKDEKANGEDDDDDDDDSEQVVGDGNEHQANMETIEKYCSVEIYQKLTLAVSYFYVRKHFPKTTRDEATKIIDHIREEFLNYIEGLQWMKDDTTPTTRELAKQKVKSMKFIVGHHDKLEDIKNVEVVYAGLKIDEDNYALANMAWNKWSTDLMWKRFRKSVADTTFWDSNSIWIKKVYNQYDNTLIIPAAAIQPPYFSPELPNYVNYAIFGRLIGDHMTQAIVNEGEHYDPSGTWFSQTWWSPETKKEQENIKTCFQEVYRGYTCRTGKYINSLDTSSNNMVDQGAVKLAYKTYKKHFPNEEKNLPHVPSLTTNQMFWLAGAHVWCTKVDETDIMTMMEEYKLAPPEIRVNAAYGMMQHFHDDFGCKEHTQDQTAHKNPLYPEKHCELW